MARVIELVLGKEGIIRVFMRQTINEEMVRSIQRICLLEAGGVVPSKKGDTVAIFDDVKDNHDDVAEDSTVPETEASIECSHSFDFNYYFCGGD